MQGSEAEESPREQKLCGFCNVVLAVNSPQENELSKTLPFGTRCYLFRDGSSVGFRSEDGIVLSLVECGGYCASKIGGKENSEVNSGFSTPNSSKDKVKGRKYGSSRRKSRTIGLVHGSMSVVHQLHALTVHKCLEIIARVVRISIRDSGDARAVLMVDVYLPLAVWSGWQFPKSGSTAAALFRHVSCDWEQRNLMLHDDRNRFTYNQRDDEVIWNDSDCHVLGCKLHQNVTGPSKNKLFELHEVFRSLPGVSREEKVYSTRIKPVDGSLSSGICEVSDDVLTRILIALGPMDLVRVAATCRHLRSVALSIMPCMKLKLFPHQQAAVEWMLQRERNASVLPHPLYMDFSTEDGFHFYVNSVSGQIATGIIPTIRDFRGGMFCDEPGLGKTITAISLILKTQETLADPPGGVEVTWCKHNSEQRCGYYELSSSNLSAGKLVSSWKVFIGQNEGRGQMSPDMTPIQVSTRSLSKRARLIVSDDLCLRAADSCPGKLETASSSSTSTCSSLATHVLRCSRRLSCVKRNLLTAYEEASGPAKKSKVRKSLDSPTNFFMKKKDIVSSLLPNGCQKPRKACVDHFEYNETWVQCDSCRKWRKLSDTSVPSATEPWFCSMNSDPFHQKCTSPEESWDYTRPITNLPGFYTKGTLGGKEQNVAFFTSVLKEHYTSINSTTVKALTWLAGLSEGKLLEMETAGLTRPVLDHRITPGGGADGYHKIFQAFGLIVRVKKGTDRLYYPHRLDNLAFDSSALRIALTKPLDIVRLYLSRATLIVVPANLVDHWKTQIRKHVKPGQLRVYVWTDQKPCAHNLAWDYDVVITTFNRLSVEWGPHKKSVLMQVHWLRIMLDEGHTLGSSLSLTNKLQMAISLSASNRWLLTGTPTPNTPNSQVSHLQPMLKFLHEEAYGKNQKSWEAGILRPFEAEMMEGRSRLLQLLHRCMISSRKVDLQMIPPCIKKATFLDFTEEHARSYNELVVTVRRNILMADWNDPSHVESLLNPKQWKFRSTTIRNVRLSCCVAGHIKVTDAGEDIQETMDILVEQGLDPTSEEYVLIKYFLLNGGNCFRCKEWCRLPVITPCKHLLCLDCVALDSERCTFPGCGNCYEMQTPEMLARPENPSPKWPVPKDLIELQPSYKQDDWAADWHATSSSKVAYLVERLKALQEANKKICCSLNENEVVKHSDDYLFPSQKSYWNVLCHEACTQTKVEFYEKPPEKVIIFSQFLEHIHVIEQQLTVSDIKFVGMYSPMHSTNKMKSLAIFQEDANCMALVMDGSAALGLDLSFVTHVFLMEPIWDRSVEEQVISRAHRMGATRPIHVETLAMRGTIEEQMLNFLRDADECRRTLSEEFGRTDREGARAHRTLHDFAESNYLAQISFVRMSTKS
ncbi:F-box protein At3g54460-like [Macadamia integrifolia]|uniref:F-box protein At3g54460-like n=1 Tax=Macadamia integrifolia TaxID=60698 RepID=UPI001C4EC573|nr:F-box protein At3g54460-like [Macadamia integrifolia]